MRLIDADAFIEYLGLNEENAKEENIGEIVTIEDFDRQPTAYDVDKVVERMEMESQNIELIYQTDQGFDYEDAIGIDIINAKQIVKSGGIE